METSLYPWFALQLRPRYEKVVAAAIRDRGYECFLPLYRRRRQWSDRMKDVELPLFPAYLFCRLDLSKRLPILTIPGVNRIVGLGRQPIPVDESEVDSVRAIVASGRAAEPWAFLKTGQKVRVLYGALAGIEGILISARNRQRLVVSMTLLQRSVAVELDADLIEAIQPPLIREATFAPGIQPRPVPSWG